MDVILEKLAEHGVLGLFVVALFLALRAKDKELTAERAARIVDAQAYGAAALAMQSKQLEVVHTFETTMKAQLEARRPGGGQFR